MSGANPAATILLIGGVGVCLISAVGLLLMEGVFDKLHYLAPAGILGTFLIAAAIVAQEGLSQGGIKALLVFLVQIVSGPVVTQAAARAAMIRNSRRENRQPEEDG